MERADGVRAGRVHGTGPPPDIFSWRVSLGAMGLCAGPLPHHLPLISAMYAVRQRSPARPNGELIRFGPEAECGQGAQQWKEANGTRFAQPPPLLRCLAIQNTIMARRLLPLCEMSQQGHNRPRRYPPTLRRSPYLRPMQLLLSDLRPSYHGRGYHDG